jgi:hypothetical protein
VGQSRPFQSAFAQLINSLRHPASLPPRVIQQSVNDQIPARVSGSCRRRKVFYVLLTGLKVGIRRNGLHEFNSFRPRLVLPFCAGPHYNIKERQFGRAEGKLIMPLFAADTLLML